RIKGNQRRQRAARNQFGGGDRRAAHEQCARIGVRMAFEARGSFEGTQRETYQVRVVRASDAALDELAKPLVVGDGIADRPSLRRVGALRDRIALLEEDGRFVGRGYAV